MNGKGLLAIAIILMCVGFGGVIHWVATGQGETQVASPPATLTSSPQLTNTERDYIEYILEQRLEGLEIIDDVLTLCDDPHPDSMAWVNDITNNMGQLEYMKADLAVTPYPNSLSKIYTAETDYIEHLVRAGYYFIDSANAKYMAEEMEDFPSEALKYMNEALNYLDQAGSELEKAEESGDLITIFVRELVPELN